MIKGKTGPFQTHTVEWVSENTTIPFFLQEYVSSYNSGGLGYLKNTTPPTTSVCEHLHKHTDCWSVSGFHSKDLTTTSAWKMLMFQSEKKRKKKIALLRLAGPWKFTLLTSLVTSVVNIGSKRDAWVTSVYGYRAISAQPGNLTLLTLHTPQPARSLLFPSFCPPPFLCSPPYSIVLCVQSQFKLIVQERRKPESCLIMSHFQAVIKFSSPYTHTCTTTQRVHKNTPHSDLHISRSNFKLTEESVFLIFALVIFRLTWNHSKRCIFDHISELRPWQSSMTLINVLYFKVCVHESRQSYRWMNHF